MSRLGAALFVVADAGPFVVDEKYPRFDRAPWGLLGN